ncbi:13049_t:CDS:2, partial [Funneliformis geosporum]
SKFPWMVGGTPSQEVIESLEAAPETLSVIDSANSNKPLVLSSQLYKVAICSRDMISD